MGTKEFGSWWCIIRGDVLNVPGDEDDEEDDEEDGEDVHLT